MLLSLRSDHKEHLQLLTKQSTEVVVDFCKLAIDYLHNGPNNKLYNTAAKTLEVDSDDVQNAVYGLVNLLILSCTHKLNEADFRDSVITIGFTNEQQTVLYKFYETKSKETVAILEKLSVHDPRYHHLNWRFEVQVASRCLLNQAIPLISMDLSLKTENMDQISHTLLQTDPMNLLHITEELEKALIESRSRYSRRIQTTFIE